jgi:hypothetical protein
MERFFTNPARRNMRIRVLVSCFLFSVIIQGCAGATTPSSSLPVETTPAVTSSQTPAPSSTTAAAVNSTPSVTSKPGKVQTETRPAVMSSPTGAQSSTPTVAVTQTPFATSETSQIQEKCLPLLEKLPADNPFNGMIFFYTVIEGEQLKDSYGLLSAFNFETQKIRSLPPEKIHYAAVSPDYKKYAVRDDRDERLKIYSVNGKLIKTYPKSETPFTVDRWLDNERIALVIWEPYDQVDPNSPHQYKYPRDQMVIDTVTNQHIALISRDLPGIDIFQAQGGCGGELKQQAMTLH